MRLGSILKKWRLISDLDLREAAEKIGIAPSTYLRIEQGKVPPHGETLIKLLHWLLEAEPEAANEKPTNAGDQRPDAPLPVREEPSI